MSNNENEKLILKLFDLFSQLQRILQMDTSGEMHFVTKEVNYIVEILNEGIINKFSESDKIIEETKQIHKSLYPPKGGLSEFFIWKSDFDERAKINSCLNDIKNELWKLLT